MVTASGIQSGQQREQVGRGAQHKRSSMIGTMKIDRSGPELIMLIKSYMEHFNRIPPVFSDDIPEQALIEMLKSALSFNRALEDSGEW